MSTAMASHNGSASSSSTTTVPAVADNREHTRFAVVCSSNMNRSMEAHRLMMKKGFKVESFGTAQKVKIPGPSQDKSNLYDFGTTYERIYYDLVSKDRSLYKKMGLLDMLDRNRNTKPSPEQFQQTSKRFDIIITCNDKVYYKVIEALEAKEPSLDQDELVHVINVDVRDTYEDAILGSFWICELARMLCGATNLDKEIYKILAEFDAKAEDRHVLHHEHYY